MIAFRKSKTSRVLPPPGGGSCFNYFQSDIYLPQVFARRGIHGMKMTDVLNPTVCFGKNVVQSKSVKESMCNTDLPVALKEDVESGSNDDLDTDKLVSSKSNVGEKRTKAITIKNRG
jgi:hypothetical protein